MRPLKRGDIVRLRVNLPADTVRGMRAMQAGHEFELISLANGWAECFDGNGVRSMLPSYAVEFVREGASPPDDDPPPAGEKRVSKLGKRRGLVRVQEAA